MLGSLRTLAALYLHPIPSGPMQIHIALPHKSKLQYSLSLSSSSVPGLLLLYAPAPWQFLLDSVVPSQLNCMKSSALQHTSPSDLRTLVLQLVLN